MKRSTMRLTLLLVTMILLLAAGAGVPGVRGATSAAPMLADGGIVVDYFVAIPGLRPSIYPPFEDFEIAVDLETLQISTDVTESQVAGDPVIHKQPGQTRYADFAITCINDCPELLNWYLDDVIAHAVVRRSVYLRFQYGKDGVTGDFWEFSGCWPRQLQGSLTNDGALYRNRFQIACETAEFNYSGMAAP